VTLTYESIATQNITGNSSVTFSSIPSTYTDLKIIFISKGNPSFYPTLFMTFNGDTATNYSQTVIYGNGSSAASNRSTDQQRINITAHISIQEQPVFFDINIFRYADSINKTVLFNNAQDKNGTGAVTLGAGLWRNTSIISSINFTTNTWFYDGTATLYGIKSE